MSDLGNRMTIIDACYRRGGPLTVTDCNVLTGKLQAQIFSRKVPPFGLAGGEAVGKGRVERANGDIIEIGATAEVQMQPGDVFVIETPGGGGYGLA